MQVLGATPRAVPHHMTGSPASSLRATALGRSSSALAADGSEGAALAAALRAALTEYSTEATAMPFRCALLVCRRKQPCPRVASVAEVRNECEMRGSAHESPERARGESGVPPIGRSVCARRH
eukprot:2669799-Pyramimonas_sp.AAC.1